MIALRPIALGRADRPRPNGGRPRARRRPHPPLSSSSSCRNPLSAGDHQVELDAAGALAYARAHLPHMFRREGGGGAEELSGGVINKVFAIDCGGGGNGGGGGGGTSAAAAALVLKQALPHVRAAGPAFPLSRARMDAEAAAMALAERAAAAAAGARAGGSGASFPVPAAPAVARPPALLHHDPAQSVLVCARVPEPPFSTLHDALVAGRLPAGPVAAPLFRLLARLQRPPAPARAASGDGAAAAEAEQAAAAAAAALRNEDIVRVNLDVVLRQPLGLPFSQSSGDKAAAAVAAAAAGVAAPPHLRADAERLLLPPPPSEPGDPSSSAAVRRAAAALDAHYARRAARSSASRRRSRGPAFAHNDLHPGNVFVPTTTRVPADGEEQGTAAAVDAVAALSSAAAPSSSAGGGGESAGAGATLEPPYLIDWEFSAPGPAEFDVGTLCGNLLLAALALPLAPPPPPAAAAGVRAAQRAWLLAEVAGAWCAHEAAVREAAVEENEEEEEEQEEEEEADSERWAVAWAGAAMIRQVLGRHRHPLLLLLTPCAATEAAERSCLALGRAMLLAAPADGGAGEERAPPPHPPPPGAVLSFGAAAAVCLELARTHEDLFGSGP